jgi:hypothetical protein
MTLRKIKRDPCQRGTHHALLALDFENDPKSGEFICAGLYGKLDQRSGHNHTKTQTDVKEFFSSLPDLYEYLLAIPKGACKLVFYNLSYDVVYLRDILAPPRLDKNGNIRASMLQVGTHVITAVLKNGIKCLDLFNHTCEGSLEDWGEYCNFAERFGVVKHDLSDLSIRVLTDAELTYRLGEFIENFYYNECEIPLQLTVGASALKLFKTKYFTDYFERDNDELSNFERQAYYGGRTEIFKRGLQHAYSYDINSTYLSIMRDNLIPDVNTIRIRNNDSEIINDLGEDYSKHLSIIECLVSSPDNIKIGVLPVRIDNKLEFPSGTFRGSWCNVELIEAIRAGYVIHKVYKYVFYNKAKRYFHDFAKFVWGKRIQYRTAHNPGMDKMIKRIGNSLYGKFGERHQTQVECKLSDIDFKIPENAEIYTYLGCDWVRIGGDLVASDHEFPAIPAFITAYARIKLLRGMQANAETLIYVDTDSIKCTAPGCGIEINEDLGNWKDEGDHDVIFYRSKFYGDKHKGVPKRAKVVETTDKYIKYSFDKPLREREAMRSNKIPNVWTENYKILQLEDQKRTWKGSESIPHKVFYDLENIILTPEKRMNNIILKKRKFKPNGSRQERELNREKMKEVSERRLLKPLGTMWEQTAEGRAAAAEYDRDQAIAAENYYSQMEVKE